MAFYMFCWLDWSSWLSMVNQYNSTELGGSVINLAMQITLGHSAGGQSLCNVGHQLGKCGQWGTEAESKGWGNYCVGNH
jgi:hypothetical protein